MQQMLSSRQMAPTPQPLNILDRISSALITEWGEQSTKYWRWWEWYDSVMLDAASPSNKSKKRYPLQINPIKWICNKHARGLFGEAPDDTSTLVQFAFRNEDGETDDLSLKAARIVDRIWGESHGSDIQIDNATISQVVGGSVYRVSKQPWNKTLSTGFRINKVVPDYFLPVWSNDDPWTFPEVYVMQYITGDEARQRYQVDPHSMPWVLYIEHWTLESYEITVADQVPQMEGMSGDNPYGLVPFVYIPHLTRAGGLYGQSHVPGLISMVEELNYRMADRGDGVRNTMFNRLFGRNIPKTGITPTVIGDSKNTDNKEMILNIGNEVAGMSGKPEVFHVESSASKGAQISREYTKDLMDMIYSDSDTPSIMFGPSVEGSQPSGDARDLEFWPYLQHQRNERAQTQIGFNMINKMLLSMMLTDGVGGVTEDMLKLEPRVQWGYPMPKRRDMKVQEIVSRRTTQPPTISLPNSLRQLSEGENIAEEYKLIMAEVAEAQKQQQETEQRQQKMTMETRRQNMQMKMQADMASKNAGDKQAKSQEK